MSAFNENAAESNAKRKTAVAPTKTAILNTADSIMLLNGAFVSLQMETTGSKASYISASSVGDVLGLDPSESPQNFGTTCVFQVLLEPSRKGSLGQQLQYGDVVLLIHRATSHLVTKRNAFGGKKFDVHLAKVLNEHSIASQFRMIPRFKLHVLVRCYLNNLCSFFPWSFFFSFCVFIRLRHFI